VIAEFIETWPLFHNAYVGGLLIAVLLSIIGIVVVGRDQIFVGAAVSQASMLGIALGILATDAIPTLAVSHDLDVTHALFGGAAAILGALITAVPATGHDTRESVTGWVFLLGASLSVLLVAHSPHGLAEVHRLLASTIIGARPADVYLLTGLLVVLVATVVTRREEIILLVTDPEMSQVLGIRTGRWERVIAIGLGAATAFAMHVAGMLYTFGLLVLPALIAKNLCSEVRQLFWVAPAIALTIALNSFIAANSADLPPAQVTVAALCAGLALAWILRFIRTR
jgi:zinc/manganese transport system permease protein